MEESFPSLGKCTLLEYHAPADVSDGGMLPIFFLLYINDKPQGVSSYMNLSADDTKLLRHVESEILQEVV